MPEGKRRPHPSRQECSRTVCETESQQKPDEKSSDRRKATFKQGFSSHRRLELHGRRRTAHSLSSHCESVCKCMHAPAERACVSRRVRPLLPPWVTTGSTHEFHSAARDLAPALLLGNFSHNFSRFAGRPSDSRFGNMRLEEKERERGKKKNRGRAKFPRLQGQLCLLLLLF